jgi:hypothetical protein
MLQLLVHSSNRSYKEMVQQHFDKFQLMVSMSRVQLMGFRSNQSKQLGLVHSSGMFQLMGLGSSILLLEMAIIQHSMS